MSAFGRTTWTRYLFWHVGVPIFFAIGFFALAQYSNLDRWASDLFYQPATHEFPLRYEWFLEIVLHQWAKYLLVLLAGAVFGGIVMSFAIDGLRPLRRPLLFILLAMMLGPASVSVTRNVAHKHCPVDIDRYGGFAPYERLLDVSAPNIRPGRCWPSSHAAGGFGLFAFYFVWWRRRPRRALAALGVASAYGLILGLGRMMQGALFLTYALWSAVIVWFVVLLVYWAVLGWADDEGHASWDA